MLSQAKERFLKIFHHDASSGIIMLLLVIVALAYQNSDYAVNYRTWLNTRAGFAYGSFELMKPLLLWINDGLISIFFFSIGLELKHEFMEGHLSKPRNIVLPALGAVGGIIVPALIFIACNHGDPYAMRGWAIPTATDTAFSLTLVLMLGKRVPSSLKVFLLSLAIFDDVGAILVIAIFYTSELSVYAFSSAGFALLVLLTMNLLGVTKKLFYCVFGFLLWLSILQSGVHATLAGIITAFFIPLKKRDGTPLVMEIYEDIKGYLSFFILPLFVFANAGIDLSGITPSAFFSGVPMGIFLGLFIGKQLGIFGVSYLCIRFKLCSMPEGATFKQLYGVCILTGIGFTMSLFIDGLAYQGSPIFSYTDSFAIIIASVLSGTAGYIYLRFFASEEDSDKISSVKKLLTGIKDHATEPQAEKAEDDKALEASAEGAEAQSKGDAADGEEASESAGTESETAPADASEAEEGTAAQAEQTEETVAPAAEDSAAQGEKAPDLQEAKTEAPEAVKAGEQEPSLPEKAPQTKAKGKKVKKSKDSVAKAVAEPKTSDEASEDQKAALPHKEPEVFEAPAVKGKSKIVISLESEAEADKEPQKTLPDEAADNADAPKAEPAQSDTAEVKAQAKAAAEEDEIAAAPVVKGKSRIEIKLEEDAESTKTIESAEEAQAEESAEDKSAQGSKQDLKPEAKQDDEPQSPVVIKGKSKIAIEPEEVKDEPAPSAQKDDAEKEKPAPEIASEDKEQDQPETKVEAEADAPKAEDQSEEKQSEAEAPAPEDSAEAPQVKSKQGKKGGLIGFLSKLKSK